MHSSYQSLQLAAGSHPADSGKGCLLEITSCLFGEPWGDSPECVCPALAAFGRTTNDWMTNSERQLLLPFTVRLGNTNDPAKLVERAFAFADFAVRVAAPIALDAAGLAEEAQRLRDLEPVASDDAASYAADAAADAAGRSASYAADAADADDDAGRSASYAADAAAARSELVAASVALLDRLCPPAPADNTAALRWDRTAHIVST